MSVPIVTYPCDNIAEVISFAKAACLSSSSNSFSVFSFVLFINYNKNILIRCPCLSS